MGIITLSGIAVSLAMDAFSVSVAAGVKIDHVSFRHYFRLAFHFGLFQFIMPVIGFYSGVLIEDIISQYDHWVAFTLLFVIGSKMIKESFKTGDNVDEKKDPSKGITLVILSIATSIDAAAVGLSLAALKIPIMLPSIFIGLICALFSALGLLIGNKIGSFVGIWAERAGGLILISIGAKILIDHLL